MSDVISRQVAISAICSACGKIDCDKIDKCEKLQLPPANCSEFPNSSDTISRKAAIDALRAMQTYKLFAGDDMLLIDQAGAQTELMMLPPAQLGANLAEVGTDCISRQAAIDGKICIRRSNGVEIYDDYVVPVEYLEQLPPAQPEIITCDRCVATKRGECIWHNAGAAYCSLGEVTE